MSEGRTKEQWENVARSYQKHITRLQNQIEKMKCCSNCNGKFLSTRCKQCVDNSNWELAE